MKYQGVLQGHSLDAMFTSTDKFDGQPCQASKCLVNYLSLSLTRPECITHSIHPFDSCFITSITPPHKKGSLRGITVGPHHIWDKGIQKQVLWNMKYQGVRQVHSLDAMFTSTDKLDEQPCQASKCLVNYSSLSLTRPECITHSIHPFDSCFITSITPPPKKGSLKGITVGAPSHLGQRNTMDLKIWRCECSGPLKVPTWLWAVLLNATSPLKPESSWW